MATELHHVLDARGGGAVQAVFPGSANPNRAGLFIVSPTNASLARHVLDAIAALESVAECDVSAERRLAAATD